MAVVGVREFLAHARRSRDANGETLKIYTVKRMNLPKIAVLATGLTAAILVATISPQAAQATPKEQQDCTECHTAGQAPGFMQITPLGSFTMAPSTDYAIKIDMATNANNGNSGWWIANSDTAGGTGTTANVCRTSGNTPAPAAPLCYGGPAGSTTFFPSMTAPAVAGTYYYKVFMNQGSPDASETYSKVFSITVTAPVETTTTTPPVETTAADPAVTTTTTAPVVVADASAVIPVGAPDTGAGGAASSSAGTLAGFGGLVLLLAGAGATQVIRRRRQV